MKLHKIGNNLFLNGTMIGKYLKSNGSYWYVDINKNLCGKDTCYYRTIYRL